MDLVIFFFWKWTGVCWNKRSGSPGKGTQNSCNQSPLYGREATNSARSPPTPARRAPRATTTFRNIFASSYLLLMALGKLHWLDNCSRTFPRLWFLAPIFFFQGRWCLWVQSWLPGGSSWMEPEQSKKSNDEWHIPHCYWWYQMKL